jgi:hypothetical protein
MRQLYSLVTGLFIAVFMFGPDGLLDYAFSSAVSRCQLPSWCLLPSATKMADCRIRTRKVTGEQRQCLVDKLPSCLSTQLPMRLLCLIDWLKC